MPLRLFGGYGSSRTRSCPACERQIAAEATFCPSCYMVIRPEGTADLRQHLQGGRIPTDVYLLRKMQAEDPDAGPVVRADEHAPDPLQVSEPPQPLLSVPPVSDTQALQAPSLELPLTAPPVPSPPIAPTPVPANAEPPRTETDPRARTRTWTGVYSLLRFDPPLPPPTHAVEETSVLLAWLLERDPIIPNNTDLLETIHADAFRDLPAARLGYSQHVLLQIADDLVLHPTREALSNHLTILAAAYRRAAGAYHSATERKHGEANTSLWQMASLASRLRVEAWVYRTRHGAPPEVTRPRRPRISRVSAD